MYEQWQVEKTILRVKSIAKIKIKGPKISKLRVKDQAITQEIYIIGPKCFRNWLHLRRWIKGEMANRFFNANDFLI